MQCVHATFTQNTNKFMNWSSFAGVCMCNTAGPTLRRWAGLTLDVHQGADVGAAHGVGHLAGDGICEVGVVHCHLQAVSVGLRDGDPAFGPPGQRWIHHITRLRGGVSPCASSHRLSVNLEPAPLAIKGCQASRSRWRRAFQSARHWLCFQKWAYSSHFLFKAVPVSGDLGVGGGGADEQDLGPLGDGLRLDRQSHWRRIWGRENAG